jgi:hypothetical protein
MILVTLLCYLILMLNKPTSDPLCMEPNLDEAPLKSEQLIMNSFGLDEHWWTFWNEASSQATVILSFSSKYRFLDSMCLWSFKEVGAKIMELAPKVV